MEQTDIDDFGKFEAGNAGSPYITTDKTLYQPPVKTITWHHTGAFLSRDRILNQFEVMGNYRFHYHVTGNTIVELGDVLKAQGGMVYLSPLYSKVQSSFPRRRGV